MVLVLPDEPERVQPPEATPRWLPEPAQDRPLAEARDVIRRILLADGTIHGNEDDPDFIPRQLYGIANAAEREGFLFRDLIPDAQGGVEHDVTFDAGTGSAMRTPMRSSGTTLPSSTCGPRMCL